jgi:hypothetical protein
MKKKVLMIIGSLFLGLPFVVAAETENTVIVSPVFQEITLDVEKTEEFTAKVSNTTSAPLTFRLSVIDFGSLDESGGVAFLGSGERLEKSYALAAWMRPETDTLTVDAGQTATVRVRIENRDDLSPGGHYGALVFRSESGEGMLLENGISINQIFSLLVFVKKVGGERYGVASLGMTKTERFIALPHQLRVRFRNTGNVHIVPRGTVGVTDPLGRLVAKGVINEESGIILPEIVREYPLRILPLSTMFVPGRYTLILAYRFDGREEYSTEEQSIWIFPWPTIVASVASMSTLAMFFRWRKSRRLSRDPERTGRETLV